MTDDAHKRVDMTETSIDRTPVSRDYLLCVGPLHLWDTPGLPRLGWVPVSRSIEELVPPGFPRTAVLLKEENVFVLLPLLLPVRVLFVTFSQHKNPLNVLAVLLRGVGRGLERGVEGPLRLLFLGRHGQGLGAGGAGIVPHVPRSREASRLRQVTKNTVQQYCWCCTR